MKLKYSARPAGYPVRDVVEHAFTTYRRLSGGIAMARNNESELLVTLPVTWQKKVLSSDDYHTIFNGQHTIYLESKFQLDVPAATPEQIRA